MNTELQKSETVLAPGLSLRAARWEDAEPVCQLMLDVCTADGDPTVANTIEELQRDWKNGTFNLETDAWVVETAEGRLVGYEEFADRYAHASLAGDGYVHPDFMGKGIGTVMLRALEARARQEMQSAEPDLRVFIRNGMAGTDTVGRELHEHEGYHPVRFSWRMEITLDGQPAAPAWPAGIELQPFTMDQNRQVWEAH